MPDLDGGSLPPPSGPPLAGTSAPDVPRPAVPAGRRRRRVGPSVRALLLVAMALLITGVVLNRATARHRAGDTRATSTTPAPGGAGAPGASVTPASVGAPVSTTKSAGATKPPGTTVAPPTTADPTTASSTVASSTAATAVPTPATDATPATPVTTPEPTAAPETAPAPGPTTAAPPPNDGRAVLLTSRVESCQFGPRCLIVGFTLRGFRSTPATFTCEFANGTRRSFPLGGLQKVGRACTTGTEPDSIRVEVDGVRSETATIP